MLLEVLSCSARHYFIARNRITVLGTAALAVEVDPQQGRRIDWVVEQPLDGMITYCFPPALRSIALSTRPRFMQVGLKKSPLVFIPKPSSAFGKVLTDDIGQD
jgi:hypothetical protein